MLEAYFSGSISRNPGGDAVSACIIMRDGEIIAQTVRNVGSGSAMTSNVAEYDGLRLILNWYRHKAEGEHMTISGDSQLVIGRMRRSDRRNRKMSDSSQCKRIADLCVYRRNMIAKDKLSFEWKSNEHNEFCKTMCRNRLAEIRVAKSAEAREAKEKAAADTVEARDHLAAIRSKIRKAA